MSCPKLAHVFFTFYFLVCCYFRGVIPTVIEISAERSSVVPGVWC